MNVKFDRTHLHDTTINMRHLQVTKIDFQAISCIKKLIEIINKRNFIQC